MYKPLLDDPKTIFDNNNVFPPAIGWVLHSIKSSSKYDKP